MNGTNNRYLDSFIETMGRDALLEIQLKKFQMMLDEVLESNSFYKNKFSQAGINSSGDIRTLDDLHKLPFTTKLELSSDQVTSLWHQPDIPERKIHKNPSNLGDDRRTLALAGHRRKLEMVGKVLGGSIQGGRCKI